MEYEAQLSFLRQILNGMHISSCVLENPDVCIPPEIDLRLRADLFDLDNYASFFQNSMAEAKDNTIYRFFDEYKKINLGRSAEEKITFNTLMIKAITEGIKEAPVMNSHIEYNSSIDCFKPSISLMLV